MTVAIVILSCAVLLLVACIAAAVVWARRSDAAVRGLADSDGFRALLGQRVVANITDGGSIRGILVGVYPDAIVLAHPEWLTGSKPAAIGGEVTIARSSVPMLQRFAESE